MRRPLHLYPYEPWVMLASACGGIALLVWAPLLGTLVALPFVCRTVYCILRD